MAKEIRKEYYHSSDFYGVRGHCVPAEGSKEGEIGAPSEMVYLVKPSEIAESTTGELAETFVKP